MRINKSPLGTLSPIPSPNSRRLSNTSGTIGRAAELAEKFGSRRPSSTTSGRVAELAEKFGSCRPSSTTSGRAAELAEKFGSCRPSNASLTSGKSAESAEFGGSANTFPRTETLHIPGMQYRTARSSLAPLSLQVVSNNEEGSEFESEPPTPSTQPQMRQVHIFANNDDKPLTFSSGGTDSSSHYGNTVENNSDLVCFSPDSDLPSFEEDESDGLVMWQTFEYDDELKTGATTLFCNFEDDFN